MFFSYSLWRLFSFGIGAIFFGIISIALWIWFGDPLPMFFGIPMFVIGTITLYFAHKIYEESEESKNYVRSDHMIGSFRPHRDMVCPKCGGEKMAVYHDRSGKCRDCGYLTGDHGKR